MDPSRVVEALSNTLLAEKQGNGTKILDEMHKIIGFVPTLLKIILEESVDVGVRQAAALYFKNNISEWWKPEESDESGELRFCIHEQDKQAIRSSIVAALVSAPIPFQTHLQVALSKIIRHDFPTRFEEFPEQVKHFLESNDRHHLRGALRCLYAFVEVYTYKKNDERANTVSTMQVFLPILYSTLSSLIVEESEDSYVLQTLIIKIFFSFINYHFPLDAMNKQLFTHWIDMFCTILGDFKVTHSDTSSSTWKRQKWALKILNRVSTRLANSFSWKLLRPHFSLLVREVIFPLMSYTEEDAELWQEDPVEYIRAEAGDWGSVSSPASAASTLLSEACVKRRGVLNNIMPFCIHILSSESSPIEKDAVLHMYIAIAEILLKKAAYKSQLESFLVGHVLPTLHAPEGYRRARAYRLLEKLSEAKFNDQNIFAQVVDEVRKAACFDSELPVRAFAALCLSELVRCQETAHQFVAPHLRELLIRLLELLRQTEFDDLNSVIEILIHTFEKEIVPIASEVMQTLSDTFHQLVIKSEYELNRELIELEDTEDLFEYRSIVATSVLDNMESILQVGEDNENLVAQLEPIVVHLIQSIFNHKLSVFFDEALTFIFSLTTNKISPLLWQLFDQLYPVFKKDACECFSEMMPCLHNYITVDREAFLANTSRIEQITAMCLEVFSMDDQERLQMHAAKLLEVILLDYRGQVNQYVPKYVELALTRLTRPLVSSELRTLCMQVVIAGLLYSPMDMLHMMIEHPWPGTEVNILSEFLKRWIEDADCFLGLHDRRLCVLGLCLIISLPVDKRTDAIVTFSEKYIPSLLLLFSGLKKAYATKASNQNEDDSDEEESETEEDLEGKALGSDEDEVDEESVRYLEMLEATKDSDDDDDDDDEDEDDEEEETLEAFDTQMDKSECDMDEYVTFYRVMTELERSDYAWYSQLINHLSEEQQNDLKGVYILFIFHVFKEIIMRY
uniref:Importin-7 n=1 Tax=Schistosoma haematobium TaxID=6185 RepID=A0A095BX74_SCHHA